VPQGDTAANPVTDSAGNVVMPTEAPPAS